MAAELAIREPGHRLRSTCGRVIPLHPERWFDVPGPDEDALLAMAEGPVLDIGCGPARHVLALASRGIAALGIDNAPSAVALARSRGAEAVLRCVFGRVPRAGRWRTALLLDGNVGIGGDPERLLARVASLLAPDGRLLLEVEPPGAGTHRLQVRTEDGERPSHWFAWAQVAADDLGSIAATAGFAVADRWNAGGRWFARLEFA